MKNRADKLAGAACGEKVKERHTMRARNLLSDTTARLKKKTGCAEGKLGEWDADVKLLTTTVHGRQPWPSGRNEEAPVTGNVWP